MASQITSLTIVYSTVYSGTDQRRHQSSASLAFVRGIRRWPVNSRHKSLVTQKMFPFDDVMMVVICQKWHWQGGESLRTPVIVGRLNLREETLFLFKKMFLTILSVKPGISVAYVPGATAVILSRSHWSVFLQVNNTCSLVKAIVSHRANDFHLDLTHIPHETDHTPVKHWVLRALEHIFWRTQNPQFWIKHIPNTSKS